MSSLQIALFKTSTLTHKGLQACLHCTERYLNQCMWACCVCVLINFYFPFFVACWMPVTRPLLSCSPFLSFQSALRASGQSCAQCPWFLDNLHSVQPEKSCSHLCAARAALICTTASCICLPLCHSRCSCLFIQRLALRLSWTEKQSRSGRISMHPAGLLGRWVFWRCRPHRIFMWETQTYCGSFGSGRADTYK